MAVFYDLTQEAFSLHGLWSAKGEYPMRRMPEDVAMAVSADVARLHTYTAGGRVRFATDSMHLTLRVTGRVAGYMPHATPMMAYGCDVYLDGGRREIYVGGTQHVNGKDMHETTFVLPGEGAKEVTVHLPLYGEIWDLAIGLDEGAGLWAHRPYRHRVPIVFYGSSITQGGCAARPGHAYEAILSRRFDFEYRNLGFSGAGKAEKAMRDYLSDQEMMAFVSDYDHNAPTSAYLKQTHFALYETIREKHPTVPYFMVTRPDFLFEEQCMERRDIIMQSYLDARGKGDKNVYFIDGSTFFAGAGELDLTMDRCHPTDEGLSRMATLIGDVMGRVLGL